jgi:Domain of unknown function (DUF4390)
MTSAVRQDDTVRPGAPRAAAAWLGALLLCLLALWAPAARAAEPDLTNFDLVHNEEGVLLSYGVDLELSRSVDEALSKEVALFFVAEAEVFRNRFYWRDQRVAHAVRRWRIVFQRLTSTYRVTFDGGLSQSYTSRAEAFAAISRSARWKIAEPSQIEEGSRHYVEFSYRLDTSQLPRPMQIGIGGQADWTLSVQRTQKIN